MAKKIPTYINEKNSASNIAPNPPQRNIAHRIYFIPIKAIDDTNKKIRINTISLFIMVFKMVGPKGKIKKAYE